MDVFEYLSFSEKNLGQVIEFCNKFGYYPNNEQELTSCLQKIVAKEGETAFKDLMQLHPDKEVILELFEKKEEVQPIMERERSRDCSCMMNADGSTASNQNFASQTNLIILVSAMIVSIAIISMKK